MVALLIVSLVCAGVYMREGAEGPLHTMRGVVSTVLTPVTFAGGAASAGESAAVEALQNASADDATLAQLREENAQLRAAVIEMEEYRLEATRLEGLLDLQDKYELTMVTGRIIGVEPDPWNYVVTVNVGARNGIEPGLPVIGPAGLLGQVIEVAPTTCDVRVITDPQSGVSAYIQGTRSTGVVRGSLEGLLYLTDVDVDVAVNQGDVIVTSGLGGTYVSGLPIGTVANVDVSGGTSERTIVVAPLQDVRALEDVSIIVQTQSESQATDGSGYEGAPDDGDHGVTVVAAHEDEQSDQGEGDGEDDEYYDGYDEQEGEE